MNDNQLDTAISGLISWGIDALLGELLPPPIKSISQPIINQAMPEMVEIAKGILYEILHEHPTVEAHSTSVEPPTKPPEAPKTTNIPQPWDVVLSPKHLQ